MQFLPHNAMLARYKVCCCPVSICLSIRHMPLLCQNS